MKTNVLRNACAAAVSGVLVLSSYAAENSDAHAGHGEAAKNAQQAEGALYACPMHPEITSDKPGDRCPKCGMFLELVKKDDSQKGADKAEAGGHHSHAAQPTSADEHAECKKAAKAEAHDHAHNAATRAEEAAKTESAPAKKDAEKTLYTCSMHPQIIRDKPGDCPICGMTLVPVKKGGASNTVGVYVDPATAQKMNIVLADVERGPAARTIKAFGKVDFAQENFYDISLKYDAWIEKMFANAQWDSVKKGEPLFELYSPELYNAAQNYIVALKTEKDAGSLTKAAKARLMLFDISDEYIADLEKTMSAPRTYVYRAKRDGYVYQKNANEGVLLKSGDPVYKMADTSKLWVNAELYEKDAPFVKKGDAAIVKLGADGAQKLQGNVSLVEPEAKGPARTTTARIIIENPDGQIRPGSFAEAFFNVESSPNAVLVPDTAILRSGNADTVFVAAGDGIYTPKSVKLGIRTDDGKYEITEGLDGTERIAVSGQFMLDSESRLREAVQKMLAQESNATESKNAEAPNAHIGHH